MKLIDALLNSMNSIDIVMAVYSCAIINLHFRDEIKKMV